MRSEKVIFLDPGLDCRPFLHNSHLGLPEWIAGRTVKYDFRPPEACFSSISFGGKTPPSCHNDLPGLIAAVIGRCLHCRGRRFKRRDVETGCPPVLTSRSGRRSHPVTDRVFICLHYRLTWFSIPREKATTPTPLDSATSLYLMVASLAGRPLPSRSSTHFLVSSWNLANHFGGFLIGRGEDFHALGLDFIDHGLVHVAVQTAGGPERIAGHFLDDGFQIVRGVIPGFLVHDHAFGHAAESGGHAVFGHFIEFESQNQGRTGHQARPMVPVSRAM